MSAGPDGQPVRRGLWRRLLDRREQGNPCGPSPAGLVDSRPLGRPRAGHRESSADVSADRCDDRGPRIRDRPQARVRPACRSALPARASGPGRGEARRGPEGSAGCMCRHLLLSHRRRGASCRRLARVYKVPSPLSRGETKDFAVAVSARSARPGGLLAELRPSLTSSPVPSDAKSWYPSPRMHDTGHRGGPQGAIAMSRTHGLTSRCCSRLPAVVRDPRSGDLDVDAGALRGKVLCGYQGVVSVVRATKRTEGMGPLEAATGRVLRPRR